MNNNDTIICLDVDSTLSKEEMLDVAAEIILLGRDDYAKSVAKIKAITNEGMNGTKKFEDSLRERLDILRPHSWEIEQVAQYLNSPPHISPSFWRYRPEFYKRADNIYIISGGLEPIILPIAQNFGINPDHVYGNRLIFNHDGTYRDIDWNNPLAYSDGKIEIIKQIRAKEPHASRFIMIGDGSTDLRTRCEGGADAFIAFVEKERRPHVMAHADFIAESFDAVAKFLGWPEPQAPEGQKLPSLERSYPLAPMQWRK